MSSFSLLDFLYYQILYRYGRRTTRMADTSTGAFKHDNTEPPKSNLVLPLFSLKGRTAIVSGAGAGIGLAIAHAYGMNKRPLL